jgi:hypothetical protein
LKEKGLHVSKKFLDNPKSEDSSKLSLKEDVKRQSPMRGKDKNKSSLDKEELKSNVQELPKKRDSLSRKSRLKLLSKNLSLKWNNPWSHLQLPSRNKSEELAECNAGARDESDANAGVGKNSRRLLKRKSKISLHNTRKKRS